MLESDDIAFPVESRSRPRVKEGEQGEITVCMPDACCGFILGFKAPNGSPSISGGGGISSSSGNMTLGWCCSA